LSTSYKRPTITDYGTIADVTEASGFVNVEDGGSKLLIHHTSPSGP
jgi:hypothetical protein